MKPRKIAFAVLFAIPLLTTGVMAAGDPPDLTVLANSTQIQALLAKARKTIQPGHTILIQKIIGIEPFVAYLDYRKGLGGAGAHENEDEIFYVVEGAGTFVTGGHIVDTPGVNQADPSAPNHTIADGNAHHIAKGDLLIVPANTPHQFLDVKGDMAVIEMRMPRPGTASSPSP